MEAFIYRGYVAKEKTINNWLIEKEGAKIGEVEGGEIDAMNFIDSLQRTVRVKQTA